MPKYFYTAKSFSGEDKTGVLEAKNERELAKVLHQEGFVLISANLEEKEPKKAQFSISLPFFQGASLTEKMMFTRNLRVMFTAGLALPRSLRILSLQAKSKKFASALMDISDEITKGKAFSDSLARHPKIFSELFQSMVKVGEESGTLEEVLKTLTQQMEREYELRSKIKGAMIYPMVIVSAMAGIGFLMLVMVVPRLAETFKELNVELPFTTQLVIAIGDFLAKKWYLSILIIIGTVLFLRIIFQTRGGRKLIDFVSLRIPIISPIVRKTNSAYAVRTLSSLFTAGVPIVRSLEIVGGAMGNIYFRKAMIEAAEQVKKGGKLSEALRPYNNVYPEIIIQMIEVGEETGETSGVLSKLADFFEDEVTSATKNLTAVIEPVLMLIVGAAVGFFAISMVQPIYSMLGAIK